MFLPLMTATSGSRKKRIKNESGSKRYSGKREMLPRKSPRKNFGLFLFACTLFHVPYSLGFSLLNP